MRTYVRDEIRIVGPAEAAVMIGVSPSRVHVLVRDEPSFPTPIGTLSTGRVWLADEVEEWAAANPRPGRGHARRKNVDSRT